MRFTTKALFLLLAFLPPLLPAAETLHLGELDEQRHDRLEVVVEGSVVDIVPDEVDDRYNILLLKDGATVLPCFVERTHALRALQDARIRLSGTYHRLVSGVRRFSGPYVDSVENLAVVTPAPADLLDAPAIDPNDYMTPKDFAKMDRRSLVGTVLATWGGRQAMLRSGKTVVNLHFARNASLPPCGTAVKVAGYPGTDLYRLILSKCVWASAEAPADDGRDERTMYISPRQILIADGHRLQVNSESHGLLIRLRGVVRALPGEGYDDRRLLVEADGFRVPVDFSSSPEAADGVVLGCEIEATGRCLLESESWKSYEVLPQLSGFAVVLRSPADLRVLRRPSWWTPVRLMALIAALIAVLLGLALWNFMLNRKAEKRGKELYEEKIDHALAEQKVEERTRLAVELHDTISQTLTGATMQMGSAAQLLATDPPEAVRHIDIATRTLDSCRQELRNCIWDLRNNALDVPDLNEAIRRTIQRLVGGATLKIRFNIPREALSDNTVHALMRIVRELATNAVRHGAAKTIRIAGALEDDILRFSVTDDGRGFDTANRPGLADGHFGLQGVEERVGELGGEMEITSKRGEGTRVAIWIRSRF